MPHLQVVLGDPNIIYFSIKGNSVSLWAVLYYIELRGEGGGAFTLLVKTSEVVPSISKTITVLQDSKLVHAGC